MCASQDALLDAVGYNYHKINYLKRLLTEQAAKLMPLTETELRRRVLAAAKQYGWRVFSLSQYQGARNKTSTGWPDLVLIKDGTMLAWELKKEGEKAKPAQQEWLDSLGAVPGCEAAVVTPSGLVAAEALLAGDSSVVPQPANVPYDVEAELARLLPQRSLF